jgi:hypothetical protein
MLPPSDSFLHQELKLAEALSNIQAIEVPPPPSYSERTGMPVTHDSFHAYSTTTEADDEDDYEEYLAPVTIHMDASIRIDGQSNTLILGSPNATNGNSAGAGPCADQPSNIQAPAQTASNGYGCAHGQTRAERLTSTILTALKDVGRASGRRPWEININAGVTVNGERNVVCAGLGPRGGGQGARKEGRDVLKQQQQQHKREDWTRDVERDIVEVNNGSRKRRAESVSAYQLGPSAEWSDC